MTVQSVVKMRANGKKRKRKGKKKEPRGIGASSATDRGDGTTQLAKETIVGGEKSNGSDGAAATTTATLDDPPKQPLVKKQKASFDGGGTDESDEAVSATSFRAVKPRLSDGVLKYVESRGFRSMTPVQAATIPLFVTNKDVAVQAVTGSGKTLAFLIPMVEMILRRTSLLRSHQIGAMVLSPTRELASQTHQVAAELCRYVSLPPPLLLVGGTSVQQDLRSFQRQHNDLVVGTPGRMEDVLTRYTVMDVSELECLVLDEADVLLDMGFDMTLSTILRQLPKMRRTGLFSATGTGTNRGAGQRSLKEFLARAGLRNPVWVNVAITNTNTANNNDKNNHKNSNSTNDDSGDAAERNEGKPNEQATPSSLSNYYLVTPLDEKLTRLVCFLQSKPTQKTIVFFLTCACVEFFGTALSQILDESFVAVETLHGKLVQKRRDKALERFRQAAHSKSSVLLCTDVAARGLDVTDIDWVVQFDAPQDPASYVHRVGRSARAGKVGSSLLLLSPKEESYVDLLRNRKVPLKPLPAETELCVGPSGETGANKPTGGKDRVVLSKLRPDEPLEDILPKVKALAMTDRDVLEKGTKAFTSYIRAYKEHHCGFIFRFASLDLGLLATSFALLRLPKMPELRDKALPGFKPSTDEVDVHAIPFLDKAREAARQKRLVAELAAGGKNAKQIKAEQRQFQWKQKQKERRQEAVAKGRNPNKKKLGRNAQLMDEWDELAKEERLYKKLRNKKITEEQYKQLLKQKTGLGGGANNNKNNNNNNNKKQEGSDGSGIDSDSDSD